MIQALPREGFRITAAKINKVSSNRLSKSLVIEPSSDSAEARLHKRGDDNGEEDITFKA